MIVTAIDFLLTIYQAILLTYTVKKQFSQMPHSILWELGNVSLIVILLSVIQYINLPVPDSTIFIILFAYVKLTSKERFLTCAFWITVDAFVMAGTLTLVSNLFDIQIGLNGSILTASPESIIIYSFAGNAAITLVLSIIARFKKVKTTIANKEAAIFLLMLLLSFSVSECFLMSRVDTQRDRAQLIGAACAFVVMILTIVLYERMSESARKQRQAEMAANTARLINEHQNEMKNVYQKMLAEQHDFRHRIAAAEELLQATEISVEKKKSIEALLEERKPDNLFVTGCMAVDAILKVKGTIMENAGIAFNYSSHPLIPLPIAENEFCMLIGNLLDNAIEGVMQLPADTPSRTIHLAFSKVWNMLFITCSNNADLSRLRRSGDSFLSTKAQPDLHGFGIENMKRIVAKANGTIEFELGNDRFTVEIMLGGNGVC